MQRRRATRGNGRIPRVGLLDRRPRVGGLRPLPLVLVQLRELNARAHQGRLLFERLLQGLRGFVAVARILERAQEAMAEERIAGAGTSIPIFGREGAYSFGQPRDDRLPAHGPDGSS